MDTKKIHFKDIFREPADGASIINIEKSLQAYNIIHDQEKLTLDQLHKEIIDRNLDNDLKIYFSKLDQYSNPQLDQYKPITHERRKKIYELLGFTDKLSEAISKIVPVLENSEKLIALVGDRISEPWIDDLDNENYWWNVYKDSLNKTLPNDVKDKVITDLDISTNTILDYLDPPDKELAYKTRGIVVGHVQSGKTSNMQGLAVKAIDAGFKIIIVLSGVNRILRAQTQRRFDNKY